MALPYQQPGLTIGLGSTADPALVRALQRDLRALGYLRQGIDGRFGPACEAAVKALQFDLMFNHGESSAGDGAAPVAIADYNGPSPAGGGRAVTAITGVLDQDLAACIDRLIGDPDVVTLPNADDPAAANASALAAIAAVVSAVAPAPFVAAMVRQESGGQHFRVPGAHDADNFVVVGLDHKTGRPPEQITSRGYGIGQYTIFHHPPRQEEVRDYILDPIRNVAKAFAELREKFDGYLVGPQSRADDRLAEHPLLPLRFCKFPPADPRYLRDCRACASAAAKLQIHRGTPAYQGASFGYQPDQYYPSAEYADVPDRADFACDWPYAARRYNGSGNDSFHYQARVLSNLVR